MADQGTQHKAKRKKAGKPTFLHAVGPQAWALFALSVVLLALFVWFMQYLVSEAHDKHVKETQWTREYLLFGTAQAIAFTVVGWLFGRQVSRNAINAAQREARSARQNQRAARNAERGARQHARDADRRAEQATQEAHAHRLEAEKLHERQRAFLVMTENHATRSVQALRVTEPGSDAPAPPAEDDLIARARQLFTD